MKERRFGAKLTPEGATFRLWAPAASRVDVLLDGPCAMHRGKDGWFSASVSGVRASARYKFRIDGEIDIPDPASAFQPDDVSGPSEVIDHAGYRWRADGWRGRPWPETVLIETHVGTFTPQGTYRAMIDRLDHLVATGITALELMPLADFAGQRNWGYDGVLWYAPDSAYGRPEDLKALIDEAHLRGLMVFLDVVYNHFGPEGNYLGRYAPAFFTKAETPWGSAIDYRVDEVRAFAIENALYWLGEYRFDGLRLDAVHAIAETGDLSMLQELSAAAGDLAAESNRHIHLVLENDDNRASVLDPGQHPPRGKYRAQWNDDYHHAWHVLLTGETQGYYRDYATSPRQDVARALESGFVYQGEPSVHRDGQPRGEASRDLAPSAFVNFLQNHDQIGNRPFGDRLEASVDADAIEAALAITLLAPPIPMLFMGEEWGSKAPFPFFCDFKGELAEAVRKGRRGEYAWAYEKYGEDVPDPLELSTFQSAVLDWDSCDTPAGRKRLELVRELIGIRRREIVPRLPAARFGKAQVADNGWLEADWQLGGEAVLRLTANLSGDADRPTAGRDGRSADLGRRSPTPRSRRGRCSGVWKHADAGGYPDRDLSPPAHGQFRFRCRRSGRPLSEGARHQPCLCLALHEGAEGQHPRLRRRRPQRIQSGTGRRSRLRAPEQGAEGARSWPDPGFRSQSCRRAFRRQSLVARRAGMGPGLAARRGVRHRLGYITLPAPGRTAAADHRHVLRRSAGKGRNRTSLRRRGRQLLGVVFRAPPADLAPSATAKSCAPSSGRPDASKKRPASKCWHWRRATGDCAIPTATKRPLSRPS